MVDEENAELNRIREDYRKKKDEARESGEAAVSHLNSEYQRRVDQVEKTHGSQMQAEREALQAQSENVRRTQKAFDQQLSSLHKEEDATITTERSNLGARVKEINSNENHIRDELVRKGDERTHDLSEQQHERLESLEVRNQREAQREKKNHALQMDHMHDSFQSEEQKIQNSEQQALKSEQQRGKYETENLHHSYEKNLSQERDRENKSFNDLTQRNRNEYRTEQENSQRKIGQLRRRDQDAELTEQKQYADTEHKTQTQYTKEQQRTIQSGEKELHDSRLHYHDELVKQKDTYRQEAKEQEKNYDGTVKEDDVNYEKTRERQKEAFLKSMKQEKTHFDESFQMNQKVHQKVMSAQERLFEKDKLIHQNQNTEAISQFNHYQEDPFYKVKAANASLSEHSGQYVFEAEVPAHEVKNIKVTVLKDRIVLSGERAFADEVAQGPHKVSAHNYQTFREEFKLDKPILEKHVQHEYANGIYRVTIPKLQGSPPETFQG